MNNSRVKTSALVNEAFGKLRLKLNLDVSIIIRFINIVSEIVYVSEVSAIEF